jgi:hypothetical protein
MKITEGYDLFLEPSSNINLCKSRDHVVTQPTIKTETWSWKAEKNSGVWHIGNLSQGTDTIEMK